LAGPPAVRPTLLAQQIACLFVGGLIAVAPNRGAFAAPGGGTVAAGSASISQNGAVTTIDQSSTRAVINWNSFNVGANQTVDFDLPSASSATLNRIAGDSASLILGHIDSNGQVYLVNPEGIVFGRTASINVGSLMATTSDISNTAFMNGHLAFTAPGDAQAVVGNDGSIRVGNGGFVALAAANVRNTGIINARLGRVALASGDGFTLDLYGDALINVTLDRAALATILDANGAPLSRYVTQDGQIIADGGHVSLLAASAQNLVGAIVNLDGVTRAQSVENHNGVIVLNAGAAGTVSIAGSVDASGGAGSSGGTIDALGANVVALSTSHIDASGARGGGSVTLGNIEATSAVVVDAGAQILASATQQGNGGSVRLLSSQSTSDAGSVTAAAAGVGGNGGSLEISSQGAVTLASSDVHLAGSGGRAGQVLLDPTNLTIKDAANSANVVSTYTLYELLIAGNDVNLSATQNIAVAGTIEGRGGVAGGTVSLKAGHDLAVDADILTNAGAVTLTAGDLVTMAPGTIISAVSQPITISGGGGVAVQNLLTSGAVSLNSSAGPVSAAIPLGVGSLTINGATTMASAVPAQVVTLDGAATTGNVTVNGFSVTDSGGIEGTGGVALVARQNILLNKDVLSGGALSLTAGGAINAQTLDASSLGGSAAIDVNAGGAISIAGNVLTNNAAFTANSTGGGFSIAGGINVGTASASIASSGALVLQSVEAGSLSALTSGSGSITLNATSVGSGGVIQNNAIALAPGAGTSLTLNAGGALNVDEPLDLRPDAPGLALTATAGGDINLNANLYTNQGPVALTAGGAITMASGSLISSGARPIALDGAAGVSTQYLVTSGDVTLASAAGPVTAKQALTVASLDINPGLSAGTTLAGQAVTLNGASTTGNLTVAGSSITDNGGLSSGGAVTLAATGAITLNQDVVARNPITLDAGGAITTQTLDTRSDGATSAIALTAGGAISVNGPVLTNNANFTATSSGAGFSTTASIDVGTAAASITTSGDLGLQSVQASSLSAVTTGTGSITLNATSMGPGGVVQNNAIALAPGSANPLTLSAGGSLNVEEPLDLRPDAAGITLAATSGGDMNLNANLYTNQGPVALTAGGVLTMAPNTLISSGAQPIALSGAQGVSVQYLETTGSVTLASSAGPVTANQALTLTSLTVNPGLNPANATPAQVIALNGENLTGNLVANGYTYNDSTGTSATNFTVSVTGDANLSQTYILNNFTVTAGGSINSDGYMSAGLSASQGVMTLTAGDNITIGGYIAGYYHFTYGGTLTGSQGLYEGGVNLPVGSSGTPLPPTLPTLPLPTDPTPPGTSSAPGSPGGSVELGNNPTPPGGSAPGTVGDGDVSLSLSTALPDVVPPSFVAPPSTTTGSTEASPVNTANLYRIGDSNGASADGSGDGSASSGADGQPVLVFGGRGEAASADLGRNSANSGAAPNVFGNKYCVVLDETGSAAAACSKGTP
jgi:filamentous hemagglutinin family protein